MRRHVLLLVHGMGDHPGTDGGLEDAWSQRALDTLVSQYEQYRILKMIPFEERFEVVHVGYGSVFDDLLTHWADQSTALRSSGVPITGITARVFDWLDDGARPDATFAWTHVADAVLYRFFPLVRQRVKAHVAKLFTSALKPTGEGAVSGWSVISHSLGCAITHDVLHAMDSTSPNEAGISILDAMVPSAAVVAMISNVSKVMETDEISVYDSQVVPPTRIRPNTACFAYLNVNHKLDPFVQAAPFDPGDDPEWKEAKKARTYLDIRLDHVHDLNVHAFDHYLAHPKCHIPLFERMCGRGSITANEKTAAENFEKIAADALLAEARTLLKDSRAASWFDVAGKFYALLAGAES